MTLDKMEEWVEENAQIIQAIYHLSGTEVNPTTWESIKIHLRKLFINHHQDMMSEVEGKIKAEIDRIKDGDIKWVGLRRALVIIKKLKV